MYHLGQKIWASKHTLKEYLDETRDKIRGTFFSKGGGHNSPVNKVRGDNIVYGKMSGEHNSLREKCPGGQNKGGQY